MNVEKAYMMPAISPLITGLFLVAGLMLGSCAQSPNADADRIRPYAENSAYWQYKGRPVLLLGGSVEDNLFQIPNLEAHLDALQAAGGNYVRCTMSARDEGNVWPFEKDSATGLYDLGRFNDEYWDRFARFLELTAVRDIIVQIELWATFDFYDDRNMRRGFWQKNPFNPKNNGIYTVASSGLPDTVASHPTQTENPFFFTVPEAEDNQAVLPYQHAFVDKLLSYTLPYGHVLYCMDNETSVTSAWGTYWAQYIREKAAAAQVSVETTEMWDPWDLAHPLHANTFDHPETYSFVDVSQNNHQTGQAHWDNAQRQRARVAATGTVRPLNNVKIYGAETSRFGSERDGLERFWRNLFGGMASARFHRPASGLGLNATAQAHLRSARMLTDAIDVFRAEPHNDLLSERDDNEAYCMAQPGVAYAVFFTDGGAVRLNVSALPDSRSPRVRWLDAAASQWHDVQTVTSEGSTLILSSPGEGFWVALVERG